MPAPFKPFGTLFGEAWAHFRVRAKTFLLIALITFLANVVFVLLRATVILFPVVFIAQIVVSILLSLMTISAIISEPQPLGDLFRRAGASFWPYVLLMLITGLVIWGGFVLLLIPGIILAGYIVFSQFVFVAEGLRGRAALRQSHAYVSGAWFDVFWRGFVMFLIAGAIFLPLFGILYPFREGPASSLVNSFVGPIIGAWVSCFTYRLYLNAKERYAGQPPPQPSGFFANYAALMIIGVIGGIIVPLAFAIVLFIANTTANVTQ